jgi:hypothetical protein
MTFSIGAPINKEIIIIKIIKYNVQRVHLLAYSSVLGKLSFASPMWSKCGALNLKGSLMFLQL